LRRGSWDELPVSLIKIEPYKVLETKKGLYFVNVAYHTWV
jgi:hypothetical protein